jgi:anti-anti-sigma regulatory factor
LSNRKTRRELDNRWENAMLVHLPPLPKILRELDRVIDTAGREAGDDAVIDFSDVEIITTPIIARLLTLRKLLAARGHRLILCGLTTHTKGVFAVTGLDKVFEFAEDSSAGLAQV